MKANGNELLRVFEALANPHRLWIVAALAEQRKYVSELAREVRLSRPLLYLHLQRLEAAGLVTERGRLTIDDIARTVPGNIAGKHIYMCGPLAMLEAFKKEFRRIGVPPHAIHYEEFSFR